MRKVVTSAVLFGTVATLLGGPAQADPGDGTHIDSLSATVTSPVQVTGTATFVDIPKLVGQDGPDATIPNIGADIRDINISRAAPKGTVNFTLNIGDQPPTANGTPEVVAYLWDIVVKTGSTESAFELWAARSAQWAAAGGTEPVFRRYICSPNPSPPPDVTCGSAITVPGRMQDGVVEWQVTANQIGASPGSVITSSAIEVVTTTSGALWGGLRLDGSGASQDEDYVVPGPTVKIGIAPAGTAPEQVQLTQNATVNLNTSAFSATLPKPATSGEYVVVAQACYGADSCSGLSTTTVTVA